MYQLDNKMENSVGKSENWNCIAWHKVFVEFVSVARFWVNHGIVSWSQYLFAIRNDALLTTLESISSDLSLLSNW